MVLLPNEYNEESANTAKAWDAFKAYLRGTIISVQAFKYKERLATTGGLVQRLEAVDKFHQLSPAY